MGFFSLQRLPQKRSTISACVPYYTGASNNLGFKTNIGAFEAREVAAHVSVSAKRNPLCEVEMRCDGGRDDAHTLSKLRACSPTYCPFFCIGATFEFILPHAIDRISQNVTKIPVAILGATGAVGQKLVALLHRHPHFTIAQLCASQKSAGKPYSRAVHWLSPQPIPEEIAEKLVTSPSPNSTVKWIFSALGSDVAHDLELQYRDFGCLVFSASSAHRSSGEVPLVASQVNPEHLQLLRRQMELYGGAIVAKPNCVVVGLALSLKPLAERFGIDSVTVHAMQSISGAGYPGVPAWDILDNLLPLPYEEQKVEAETPRVLGKLDAGKVTALPIKISARCLRVAVTEGHTLAVGVRFIKKAQRHEVIEAWRTYSAHEGSGCLATEKEALRFIDHPEFPQPRLHREVGEGMTCVLGSLRACNALDWKFLALTHNTVQGAAGGLIMTAELTRSLIGDAF